jgi:hypothetical protein
LFNKIDPSLEAKTKKKKKIMIEIPDEEESEKGNEDEYFPLDKHESRKEQMSQISIKSSQKNWNSKIKELQQKGKYFSKNNQKKKKLNLMKHSTIQQEM